MLKVFGVFEMHMAVLAKWPKGILNCPYNSAIILNLSTEGACDIFCGLINDTTETYTQNSRLHIDSLTEVQWACRCYCERRRRERFFGGNNLQAHINADLTMSWLPRPPPPPYLRVLWSHRIRIDLKSYQIDKNIPLYSGTLTSLYVFYILAEKKHCDQNTIAMLC